jgi:hypothetical protein
MKGRNWRNKRPNLAAAYISRWDAGPSGEKRKGNINSNSSRTEGEVTSHTHDQVRTAAVKTVGNAGSEESSKSTSSTQVGGVKGDAVAAPPIVHLTEDLPQPGTPKTTGSSSNDVMA